MLFVKEYKKDIQQNRRILLEDLSSRCISDYIGISVLVLRNTISIQAG
jgi:hypothetical protein